MANNSGNSLAIGVGLPHQNASSDPGWYENVLKLLKPIWWQNWLFDQDGPNYLPMVWSMHDNFQSIAQSAVAHQRRGVWLLGNEPELPSQSNTPPDMFARNVDLFAENSGKTIALPGILCNPYSYQWMESYFAAGGRTPDFYLIHNYAWHTEQWISNLEDFYRLIGTGSRERQVIINECGLWYDNLDEQKRLMSYIDARVGSDPRLSRALHFSAHYGSHKPQWAYSDLIDKDENITPLGQYYVGLDRHTVFLPVVVT